jgi:phage FluMu protein Com
MSAIKCPHCEKIFLDSGGDECPFCKKIIRVDKRVADIFKTIFGGNE